VSFSVEGTSVENRPLYLVHLSRQNIKPKVSLFFFGQQHGNEPAGKDALIYLIKYISENPNLLPEDVDLWIMPMVNPDGAEKNQRRNANNADLNRDHQLLLQPETETLHKVFRKIMPWVAVDCHEFGRDSKDYTEKGWTEWPIIMMDCCNNPFFNSKIYNLGVQWCEQVKSVLSAAGHNYTRYFVGGAPPEEEQRYSTPEVNDARNGLGCYGGLNFIIESGLYRTSENVNADIAKRVDAYLILLKQLIALSSKNSELAEFVQQSRSENINEFIPTNYFWGNVGFKKSIVNVISQKTNEIIEVSTMNFMKDLVVKGSIRAPKAYVVEAKNSEKFLDLLDRHAVEYTLLNDSTEFVSQSSRLITIESFRDSLYNRYEDRQIVELGKIEKRKFPKSSIYISLKQKSAMRVALHLEPNMLYGIYEHESFRALIDSTGVMPVWRVLE
jgi:hypothetical protein